MVVHTSFAIGSCDLGEVLGRVAIGIETDIELALAVGVTVVVDILIVEGNLDVLGEVEIETGTVEFGGTAVDGLVGSAAFVVVHVEEFIFGNEFDVAPAAASAHAVKLGAVGVVALLAAEEEAGTFDIPALEVIRLVKNDLLRIHVGPIRQPGTFDTQTIVVASEFSSGDEAILGVLDIIGIDVFLAADVGGIAAAEACAVVNAHLIGSLGCIVHDSATDVQSIIGLIDGTHHNLTDV